MTADPAPRLAEIKERWRMVDRISPDDVDYVLTVAERAAALLEALRANSERYQPGDNGEAESWYVQGGIMAWADGEPPEPNPYGGQSQVYEALRALSEALGFSTARP